MSTSKTPNEILSEHVRAKRKEQKLSQEGLAEKAGMDVATVKRIEGSTNNPRLSSITALAKVLGMKAWEFLR